MDLLLTPGASIARPGRMLGLLLILTTLFEVPMVELMLPTERDLLTVRVGGVGRGLDAARVRAAVLEQPDKGE